jgi:hypothetical protein
MELDRWTYREIYEKTERTDRQRNINTDRRADGHSDGHTERQTKRQKYRQMVSGLRIKM